MDINKTDHPELWEAKLRRFKRKVAQIVAESRAAHHLQDLELGQITIQRQQAREILKSCPHFRMGDNSRKKDI